MSFLHCHDDVFVKQVSAIDPASEQGERPDTLTGKIEFSDVVFEYPARPGVQVVLTHVALGSTSIKGASPLGVGSSWIGHQCGSWADGGYSGDHWVWQEHHGEAGPALL